VMLQLVQSFHGLVSFVEPTTHWPVPHCQHDTCSPMHLRLCLAHTHCHLADAAGV
jgi:hypothetical protein